MINANVAVSKSQAVNRSNWIRNAENKLSALINTVAETGNREVSICLNEMIQGAENLYECAEMMASLNKIIKNAGYKQTVTIDGNVIISW